jgi:hypothetical protein
MRQTTAIYCPLAWLLLAAALCAAACTPSLAVEGGACEKQDDCAPELWCLGRVCQEQPGGRPEAGGGRGDSGVDGGGAGDVGTASFDEAQDGGSDGESPTDTGTAGGDAESDGGCIGRGTNWCGEGTRCDADSGICAEGGMIRVDPEVLDFGCVDPGNIIMLNLTVSNVGKGVLTILDIGLESQDPGDAGFPIFSVETPRDAPFTLAPAEWITLTVSYRQDDAIQDTNALIIASDDPMHPLVKVPFRNGYKSVPDFGIIDRSTEPPTTLYPTEGSTTTFMRDLGEIPVGSSQTEVFSFANMPRCSDAILSIEVGSMSVLGANPISIAIGGIPYPRDGSSAPIYLSPRDAIDVTVEYSPTVPSDTDETELTLKTNDGDVNNDGSWDDGILTIRLLGRTPP